MLYECYTNSVMPVQTFLDPFEAFAYHKAHLECRVYKRYTDPNGRICYVRWL